MRLQIMARI